MLTPDGRGSPLCTQLRNADTQVQLFVVSVTFLSPAAWMTASIDNPADHVNLKDKAQDSTLVGPEELLEYRDDFYRAIPDLKFEIQSVSPQQGDTVCTCCWNFPARPSLTFPRAYTRAPRG